MKQIHKHILLWVLSGVCVFAALAGCFIEQRIDPALAIILVVGAIGLMLVLRGAVFTGENKGAAPGFFKGILSAGLIVLWVLWLAGMNYLGARFDTRFDVTAFKQHTLSGTTKKLVGNLIDDLKFTVLYVGIPEKYVEDLVNEYARASKGKITVEIIDPLQNIGYAARFGNTITGNEQRVVVESSDGRQDVDFSKAVLTEELLNNAILRVTREKRVVYFLSGHQEYDINEDGDAGLTSFVKLLDMNNIESRKLVLAARDGIPDDCDVLIIPGPRDFLDKKETDIIQQYLKKGGDALFLVENTVVSIPEKPLSKQELEKNPSLNEILNLWGLDVKKDVVVDLASHASGDVGSPATKSYMSHRAIVNGLDYTFYVRPRSISILSERDRAIRLAPLVVTASQSNSWGETDRYLNVKYDKGDDRPGPVPIAFVVWERKTEENAKESDTRLAVFTDADFLTNVYVGSYSNAEMGLSLINWLSEMDYQSFLGKKEIDVAKLDLTSRQKRLVLVILSVVPFLIFIFGVSVYLLRVNAR